MVAREVHDHEIKRLKGIEAEHQACAAKIQFAEKSNLESLKAKDDIRVNWTTLP